MIACHAFRRELLFDSGLGVFQQGVVFRVLGNEVGRRGFGTFEDLALTVLAPGFAEELANLFAGRVKHPPPPPAVSSVR